MKRGLAVIAGFALLGTGCAGRRAKSGVEVLNLTGAGTKEDSFRVTDLLVTRKMTGRREFLFFSFRKETEFLEGFIRGKVLDWDGNPVEGVRIHPELEERRASSQAGARVRAQGTGSTPYEASYFDAAVSNAAGDYALRFSVPIVDGVVDVRGSFKYNPGWEQRVEAIGGDYKPHIERSPFRLYYSQKFRFLVFAEGPRPIVVQKEGGRRGATVPAGQRGRVNARNENATRGQQEGQGEDDLFKGLFE